MNKKAPEPVSERHPDGHPDGPNFDPNFRADARKLRTTLWTSAFKLRLIQKRLSEPFMEIGDDVRSVYVGLVIQSIGLNNLQEELLDNSKLIGMISDTNWIDIERAKREVRYMILMLDCWYDDPQTRLCTHIDTHYGVNGRRNLFFMHPLEKNEQR